MEIPGIPFRAEVKRFVQRVITFLKPNTIILYGSMARGDYGVGSDIDILVIAENLPDNFDRRLRMMAELNDTTAPIECLAYTPEEFEEMLERMHPTALYALDDGIIIYDNGTIVKIAEKFQKMKRAGTIKRFKYGWIINRCSGNHKLS